MPTIVKLRYIKLLMEEIQKPEYDGLSDNDIAVKLNAPRVVSQGLFVRRKPDPPFAQEIGIGEVFAENISQLRVYIASGDEDKIKYDLVGHLFSRIVLQAFRENSDVTADEILATETGKKRAALIEKYTTVGDVTAHKAVVNTALEFLRLGGVKKWLPHSLTT